jgi:DNA-binding transcriptional ArsR family regulator
MKIPPNHDVEPALSASLTGQLQANAARACALLRALGHEERLLILCSLIQGERCVGDIEAQTAVSQPTLSQHLTVLRANGCVSTRREGRRIYYSLSDPATAAVIATLHQWFCREGEAPTVELAGKSMPVAVPKPVRPPIEVEQ